MEYILQFYKLGFIIHSFKNNLGPFFPGTELNLECIEIKENLPI